MGVLFISGRSAAKSFWRNSNQEKRKPAASIERDSEPPTNALHGMACQQSDLFFFYLTPAARCNFSLLYTVFRRMCSSTDVFLPAMCSTHFTQESSLPHTHTHTRLSLWPMQSSSSPEVTHQPVPGARRSTTPLQHIKLHNAFLGRRSRLKPPEIDTDREAAGAN